MAVSLQLCDTDNDGRFSSPSVKSRDCHSPAILALRQEFPVPKSGSVSVVELLYGAGNVSFGDVEAEVCSLRNPHVPKQLRKAHKNTFINPKPQA